MDKSDNQVKTEETLYRFWEELGLFKADPASAKNHYSILMPPPNLTGEPHAGHTIQHLIMDALARFKRMQGYDVLFQPGVDHAGIQFEGTLNKLLSKEGQTKETLGRDKWMERAWQFKEQVYQSFHTTWRAMGISADWSREVFTLDLKVQTAVLEEFKTFWEQDLLYKGAYMVQWCPKDQTAIEDIEMEYEERSEKLYFVRYKIESESDKETVGDSYIVIATARPETIYADTGIATYPNHPKFAKFAGKVAINPLSGDKIPVFEDDRVDQNFGTGALKITPGHDLLDYEIGKDHNLPILHAVDKTGRMTGLAKELEGLKVAEARVKAVEKLEQLQALEKTQDYTHSVPVCERCKTTVEPLISEEWFVKMKPLAEKALQNISKINFIPANFKSVISDWLKQIHDWSISRSLWWGHRIPVWYCQACNPTHKVGQNEDLIISTEEPSQDCKTCHARQWVQDGQILDTWFSSGLWPLVTLGWPQKTIELAAYYPFNFEISAPEIKYLWIARMIMLGGWFKNDIPFKNMFFTGTLRDFQGRKFSKSLGNGVFPLPLIEQWGTDSYRMAIFSYTAPARDGKTSKQVLDERCKNFRNFSTKLRNIHRFIIDLKPELAASDSSSDHEDDKQIILKLNQTIASVTKNIEDLELHLATETLYEFIWHEFADKYIEKTKNRRADAQSTLEQVLKTSLELLHPFMPFITEELWQKLPHQEKSIMIAKWPKV